MQRVSIDVCDYTGKSLCNLYDSTRQVDGQAFEVYIQTQRNGFKELKFQLPSVCMGENGEERNYRLDYLINDYRIKFQKQTSKGTETDWFLVSESKVTHQAFSQNYDIRAGHISSLLNTKNLNLEFSDEEGNNVGTIGEIAATILEGTGWTLGEVAHFYEEKKYGQTEDVEKVRSFTASTNTGAFKMMSDLCELFDAKPIYHGEGRTVDILPMNPFSEDVEEGVIPAEVVEDKILELYYDKNVKSITRTMNTDNLVTKLSSYGSYGDRTGLCSLQKAKHEILHFTDLIAEQEYKFIYNSASYYFIAGEHTEYYWSALDFASRSYVYNLGEEITICEVYREPKTNNPILIEGTVTEEYNYIPSVMDFRYYRKIGLLTDEQLQAIAEYQITVPQKYQEAEEASLDLSSAKEQLFRTAAADGGFLKLRVASGSVSTDPTNINYGQLVLTLGKTNDDGVIYRSDYAEAKRNYFSWNVATGIKDNGMSISGTGGVVYIVNTSTSPTSWIKSYVKMIGNGTNNYFYDSLGNYYNLITRDAYDNIDLFPLTGIENIIYVATDTNKMYIWNGTEYKEIKPCNYEYGLNKFDEPATITLWCGENAFTEGDVVYLFSSDSLSGLFGPREDAIYSNRESIEKTIETVTERHPLEFINENDDVPELSNIVKNSYGWYYRSYLTDPEKYAFGDLYFCYGQRGDNEWIKVYISKTGKDPEKDPDETPSECGYYYSIRKGMLYKLSDGTWTPLDKNSTDDKRVNAAFASVICGCVTQEKLTKGLHETYTYVLPEDLPGLYVTKEQPVEGLNGTTYELTKTLLDGNYAFINEFDTYWLFTTGMEHFAGDTLLYDTSTKVLWQDSDEHHILKPREYMFDVLVPFPVENEMSETTFSYGKYDEEEHTFEDEGEQWISNKLYIHENTVYEFNLPEGSIVVLQDTNGKYKGETTASEYLLPENTQSIRIVCPPAEECPITSEHYVRVKDYNTCFFVENKRYNILQPVPGGETTGIYDLMDKFISLSDEAYLVKLTELRNAQDAITQANLILANTLGDMYREGYWQKNDYVEGDEYKLYVDSLDNLKEISHPETNYEVDYIELYKSDKNVGLSIDESTEEIDYPDVDITWAAHLVDMDIDTNRWAYIDTVNTCYDQPWKSTLEINTQLSTIGQQSFTDVLSKIAEVSNETRANQTLYQRASALTGSGKLSSDKLEGILQTSSVVLDGGTANWYTDSKGNMIFESADGESAVMVAGRGLMISQEKDVYGDWDWMPAITGRGIMANAIRAGYISSDRIEAGSITADKISSTAGGELEIGSNKALNLFATVDGKRPAGSLETAHNEEDPNASWISISAGDGETPASIIIKTNDFLVDSPRFKIIKDEETGEYTVEVNGDVVVTEGNIAGYTVVYHIENPDDPDDYTYTYMYTGDVSDVHTEYTDGVYIGTNGVNIGGRLMYILEEDPDNPNKYLDPRLDINANTINVVNFVDVPAKYEYVSMEDVEIIPFPDDYEPTEEEQEKIDLGLVEIIVTNENGAFVYKEPDTSSVVTRIMEYRERDWILLDSDPDWGCIYTKPERVFTYSFSADGETVYVTGNAAIQITSGYVNIEGDIVLGSSISGYTIIQEDASMDITTNGQINIGGNGQSFNIGNDSLNTFIRNGMESFDDTSNNGIYIGTDGIALGAGNFKVDIEGNAIGTISSPSSYDYKHNIKPLTENSVIDKLEPVSFSYNDDNQKHFGLIYEDTIDILPEICCELGGIKTISYLELVPVLLKEIQDLRKRIAKLEKE